MPLSCDEKKTPMRSTPLDTASRWIAASIAVVGLLCGGAARGATAEAVRRPNVLVIYTDDQGTVDANCYGSSDLVTPSIDALARVGVRFTQMYAPSAICSASRAGLMTGRFPARAGVPGNVSSTRGQPGMLTEADQRFLANLAEDATEMKNLATEHPDVLERLDKLHEQYTRDIGDP